MASKTIIMYAKKKYELGDFKDAIKSEFYILKQDVEFAEKFIEN